MEFLAKNEEHNTVISFHIAEGNLIQEQGVSFSLDEAKSKSDALLKEMGLDFVLVDAMAQPLYTFNDDNTFNKVGDASYTLIYKRHIDGVPQDHIVSGIDQNIGDDYKGAVPQQETITITLDDYGVNSFSWNPMEVTSQESANVALMPFDEVKSRIVEQLKMQTMWDEQADAYEAEDIVSRRLEVSRLQLSYLLIEKQNDIDSYYLMPVWNLCGDMYYHYRDDYPTGESDTYILDENFERNPWRMRDDTRVFSVLTLNAVDGSVIPRRRQ
jgi:hypothetical protein